MSNLKNNFRNAANDILKDAEDKKVMTKLPKSHINTAQVNQALQQMHPDGSPEVDLKAKKDKKGETKRLSTDLPVPMFKDLEKYMFYHDLTEKMEFVKGLIAAAIYLPDGVTVRRPAGNTD